MSCCKECNYIYSTVIDQNTWTLYTILDYWLQSQSLGNLILWQSHRILALTRTLLAILTIIIIAGLRDSLSICACMGKWNYISLGNYQEITCATNWTSDLDQKSVFVICRNIARTYIILMYDFLWMFLANYIIIMSYIILTVLLLTSYYRSTYTFPGAHDWRIPTQHMHTIIFEVNKNTLRMIDTKILLYQLLHLHPHTLYTYTSTIIIT